MKQLIVILCLIAAASTVATSTKAFRIQRTEELVKELQDFQNIISVPRLLAIVSKHYLFDGDFRMAVKFLSSSQLDDMYWHILDTAEYAELVNYLRDFDFEVDWNVPIGTAKFRAIVLQTVEVLPAYGQNLNATPRTVDSFIQEVINIIPRRDFQNMVRQKNRTSAVFGVFQRITSQDSLLWTHVETALHSAGFKSMVNLLSNNGINVQNVLNQLRKFIKANL